LVVDEPLTRLARLRAALNVRTGALALPWAGEAILNGVKRLNGWNVLNGPQY
jgi:hypothetical protein